MRRLKNKQVLLKRIRLKENEYDFIINDKQTALNIIAHTKNNTDGIKFVKANLYDRFMFSFRRFFSEKNKEIIFSIILITLTLLGQYVYDKWINPMP
jgi:hypothetical protein